jgi:hypothetical protein
MKASLRRLVRARAERLFAVRRHDWLGCVHEVVTQLRHEAS